MPTYGVEIAVFDAGKVLLIKRRDFQVWALPGGGIDAGESVAQAAVRETREETGLEVELQHLVGVYSRPTWCQGGDHDLLFSARPIGGEPIKEGDETLDVGFFAPDALPKPFVYWHRQRIDDVLAGAQGIACRQDTCRTCAWRPLWMLSASSPRGLLGLLLPLLRLVLPPFFSASHSSTRSKSGPSRSA